MKIPLTFLITILSGWLWMPSELAAQSNDSHSEAIELKPPPPKLQRAAAERLDSQLYRIQGIAKSLLSDEALERINAGLAPGWDQLSEFQAFEKEVLARGMRLDAAGRINVEAFGPLKSSGLSKSWAEEHGALVSGSWQHLTELWIPAGNLVNFAELLPDGYFIQPVLPLNLDHHSPGPEVVNSSSYIEGNADGSGITIAVLDAGYVQLTASEEQGHAPTGNQVEKLVCTSGCANESGIPFFRTSNHGTGSVESVFSHAPGANYRLYSVSGLTQIGLAVIDALDHGARIFTHSLSHYNQGWADGSGAANMIADWVADSGGLFFTSAGNQANQHWQGTMLPNPGGWHRFSGADTTIAIFFPSGGRANFFLQWDTSGGVYDYDLYLFDDSLTEILEHSDNVGNQYESFNFFNNTGQARTVHLRVARVSGGNTDFELFMHPSTAGVGDFQHQVQASSITSPSNSLRANVFSNAAVDWQNHDSGNGAIDIIADFSSRGPSNSGGLKPDLTGPTNVATICCGGSFGGTSAATPNNAGAAAALWSAHPNWSASAVRWLMVEKARRFKDWGEPGKDNVYGWGGSFLYDYYPSTTWLAKGFGNTTNLPTGPYTTLEAAYSAVVFNGVIMMVPHGGYPESFSSGVRRATLRSIQPTTLGAP